MAPASRWGRARGPLGFGVHLGLWPGLERAGCGWGSVAYSAGVACSTSDQRSLHQPAGAGPLHLRPAAGARQYADLGGCRNCRSQGKHLPLASRASRGPWYMQ